MADKISIHPKIDPGIQPAAKDFAGGDLICKCAKDPVRVTVRLSPHIIILAAAPSVGSRKAHHSHWWQSFRATS
jgi:hypothetical protein